MRTSSSTQRANAGSHPAASKPPHLHSPLGNLSDSIPLEIVTEIAFAHHALLASKSGKKASTNPGAIHTGNEGQFIRRYRFEDPAFPHHPTVDPFFTEVQFEAYRTLGEYVGDKMFLAAITGFAHDNHVILEEWFHGLGKSFLDPLGD